MNSDSSTSSLYPLHLEIRKYTGRDKIFPFQIIDRFCKKLRPNKSLNPEEKKELFKSKFPSTEWRRFHSFMVPFIDQKDLKELKRHYICVKEEEEEEEEEEGIWRKRPRDEEEEEDEKEERILKMNLAIHEKNIQLALKQEETKQMEIRLKIQQEQSKLEVLRIQQNHKTEETPRHRGKSLIDNHKLQEMWEQVYGCNFFGTCQKCRLATVNQVGVKIMFLEEKKELRDLLYSENVLLVCIGCYRKNTDFNYKPPDTDRTKYWLYNNGTIYTTFCFCCRKNQFTFFDPWHGGHDIAFCNGGTSSVLNIRTICQSCNIAMSTENMEDFIERKNYRLQRFHIGDTYVNDKNRIKECNRLFDQLKKCVS